MKVDERSEDRLVIQDGYILKMPVEAAVALLDPLFENVRIGRMNGKTRMLYNQHSAWCTIKAALDAKQKRGKWVGYRGEYTCNRCGSESPNDQYNPSRYCPHCGAKMFMEADNDHT